MYIATIGFFDGVHVGHQKLISSLKEIAKLNKYKSLIYTFDKVAKVNNNLIYPFEKKLQILSSFSVDKIVVLEFDKVKNLSPKEFFERYIYKKNITALVVGKRFKFGKNASGDTKLLFDLGVKYKVTVIIIDEFKVEIDKNIYSVSSSLIREKILEGDFEKVKILLGREYTLEGKIVEGNKLGRYLNIPTINFVTEENLITPYGVISGFCVLGSKKYLSVANFGYRPTVDGEKFVSEVHIIDEKIDKMIYNTLEFIPVKKIRNEKKFSSLFELKKQIQKDIKISKSILLKLKGGS